MLNAAFACSLFTNMVFMTDPSAVDTVAPTMAVLGAEVARYDDGSCDEVLSIAVDVTGSDDASGGIGFEMTVVSGDLGDRWGLDTPAYETPGLNGRLMYYFDYDAPTVDVVEPDRGCSAGGGRAGGGAVLIGLAALFAARRRTMRA